MLRTVVLFTQRAQIRTGQREGRGRRLGLGGLQTELLVVCPEAGILDAGPPPLCGATWFKSSL